MKLRTSRPALTISRTASAASTTSRLARSACPEPVDGTPIAGMKDGRRAPAGRRGHAGTTPASKPASSDAARPNASAAPVEPDRLQAREALRRHRRQQPDERPCEQEAQQAAADREHEALDDELLREPAQAGAERGTDGHLAPTRVPAREQQVRDVRARHEQHQRHAGHQQKERGTDAFGHLVDQGTDADLDRTTLAEHPIDAPADA